MATNQFLVRDIPPEIHSWIGEESHQRRMTQKDFVLSVLEQAHRGSDQLPLFDAATTALRRDSAGVPFGFIDLFAGIGGMRLGVEGAGGHCLYSCEWDEHAQKTYKAWYGETPAGDITKILPADIPDHDVLVAGFPCQPFSLAGVSKKNSLGLAHGFKDATQGNLFFNLATIIKIKRPPVLMLENVKNLQSHDKGRTWEVIRSTLEDLGYRIFSQILDAAGWVPQHRERVFIVGFDKKVFGENPPFEFPTPPVGDSPKFQTILEGKPDPRYTLTDHLWTYLQEYARRHREKGNGFGFGLVKMDGVSRTLSARYYKDGSEILIPQPKGNPRRLTPREAARLMGFPDKLPIVVSDTQAYRQFGNAVVPPVAEAVARQIVKVLHWYIKNKHAGCIVKAKSPVSSQRSRALAGA